MSSSPPEADPLHSPTQRRGFFVAFPAWVGSTVLHLVLLVVFALAFTTRSAGIVEEPERRAGIVLAKASESGEVEYFQDQPQQPSEPTPEHQSSAVPESTPTETRVAVKEFLPDDPSTSPLDLGGAARVGRLDLRGSGNPLRHLGRGPNDGVPPEFAPKKSTGPPSPKTSVSLFGGAEVKGSRFVFALDRSNSMGSRGLAILGSAKIELLLALDQLQSVHRFQVIAYNNKVAYAGKSLAPATPRNKQIAQNFLNAVTAAAGTKHYEAISKALRMTPQPDVLFVLTDADRPHPTNNQLQELTRRNLGRRTAIHVIQFGDGPPKDKSSFFRRLAAGNGGTFRYVDVSKLRRAAPARQR
jgi:hypothetical protein